MTEINQSNFRSLLPIKEANVIMKIKQSENLTLKEAYEKFFSSEIYRELEREETKRWWQSAEQIFEDGMNERF